MLSNCSPVTILLLREVNFIDTRGHHQHEINYPEETSVVNPPSHVNTEAELAVELEFVTANLVQPIKRAS